MIFLDKMCIQQNLVNKEAIIMNELYKNFNGEAPKIDPKDAVMLLIDHQSGLFQCINDMDFKRSVIMPLPLQKQPPLPASRSLRRHPFPKVPMVRSFPKSTKQLPTRSMFLAAVKSTPGTALPL